MLATIATVLAGCGAGSNTDATVVGGATKLAASVDSRIASSVLPGKRADYRIERVNGMVQLTQLSTALVTRVAADARVRFSDYTLGMDVEGNAGKVYRIYQAAFNRTPDMRGLSFWIQKMDDGATLDSIAQAFVASTEYKSVYGINPTEGDIIARFYQNVLHREGESGGVSFWTSVLRNKSATVAAVLAGFSESPENQAGVFAAIGNGIGYREDNVSYIAVAHAGANRSVSVGTPITLDGTESVANNGATVSYRWAITARPASSGAALLNATTALPSFTPDKVGAYIITLTFSDGNTSATASVTVNASPAALAYAPLDARYSRALDKLITISSNPNALKIVDPFSESVRNVPLPTSVKSFSISPNGKLAIVLHESVASLVDLESATLVKSFATGGSHTDAFITNAAVAYFVGQTGGQWVRPSVVYFNARTGAEMTLPETNYMGMFYGTQYGVYAPGKNKVFVMSQGLSPADISYFEIDPATNGVIAMGDSPYHGDYSMRTPLYLSENEDLLFTSSGNYFYASNLKYAGTFGLQQGLTGLSNSTVRDETLVLTGTVSYYPASTTYPSNFRRFAGPLLFADGVFDFPVIDGKQSYGINIWHSADGRRLALVQTGSATENGMGVKYYVIVL